MKQYSLTRQLLNLALLWTMLGVTTYLFVGCRHNVNATAPTTPYQQVLLNNQGLAQANQDIAKVIEALNVQGLISTNDARAILTVQFQVAAADKKLTLILEQGQGFASGQASTINGLIGDITTAINTLVTQGLVGVKDAEKQQQLAADISAISGLARLIVSGLQTTGVLKAQNGPESYPQMALAMGGVL